MILCHMIQILIISYKLNAMIKYKLHLYLLLIDSIYLKNKTDICMVWHIMNFFNITIRIILIPAFCYSFVDL